MKEEWKEIENTNKRYYVSNTGKVKSCKNGKEIILKPQKDKDGYLQVGVTFTTGVKKQKDS